MFFNRHQRIDKRKNNFNLHHTVVPIAVFLIFLSLHLAEQVHSRAFNPMSFIGRTPGKVNNHLLDKIVKLTHAGKVVVLEMI